MNIPKQFTQKDVQLHGAVAGAGVIFCLKSELLHRPPAWMKRGLQETASGYGARLNSGYFIQFCNRFYRIYVTCYGNAGSCWFKTKGRKIFVNAH